MATAGQKDPGALLTIGELSQQLGVAQHILRYWETKFPQLKPMQRAGNRRYYRAVDVALAHRIHGLLTEQGYTIRGVQKLLRGKGSPSDQAAEEAPQHQTTARPDRAGEAPGNGLDISRLVALRDRLAAALTS
ncbi:MAG: MerR family transcriptional regulator [Sphingomicrobium sp.]